MSDRPKHECKRCGMVEAVENYRFCGACRQQLNDIGLCASCGIHPRKPRPSPGRKQSRYCPDCQDALSARIATIKTIENLKERLAEAEAAIRQGINIRDHNLAG
jgi:hypothetical protein